MPTEGQPGNAFRRRRRELHLTIVDVFLRIRDHAASPESPAQSLSLSTLGNWERDRYAPDLAYVPALALAYNLSEHAVEQEILAIGRRLRQPSESTPPMRSEFKGKAKAHSATA